MVLLAGIDGGGGFEEGAHLGEEFFRWALADVYRGEGVEEAPTVAHLDDAAVGDNDGAAVGAGADEAAEALFEADDGAGDDEVVEGVAALRLEGFELCFLHGFGGDGKGKAGDDEEFEGAAFYVHAFPEAGGGKEDACFVLAKACEEAFAVF